MKELLEKVNAMVSEELQRAESKFSGFNSSHEGYAVILEELEEAMEEAQASKEVLDRLWQCVKKNSLESKVHAEALMEASRKAAAEFIQVAAMAQRFIKDLE